MGASPTAQDQEAPEFMMQQDEEEASEASEPFGQTAPGINTLETHADGQLHSRASFTQGQAAFSRLNLEDPAEKQLRIARDTLNRLYEADITNMTTRDLSEHSLKQETYQRIVDTHENRLAAMSKRKRMSLSTVSASESHANRSRSNKLELLLKGKCPELSSASQAAFDTWRQLVHNRFMMITGVEHDCTQRSRWALSGISRELTTLVSTINKACDQADELGTQFTWQMLQNLLQDTIKNPTVRRTEIANTYFNCRQKSGQTVQQFSEFLKNLEDRMDIPPFEDGNTKVDFYFAKLIDSLQGEVVKANVIKDCHVVDDLIANATRFEQISKATGKTTASHENRTDISRESRPQRGRGRGTPNYRGQSRGGRGSYGPSYGNANNEPQGPRPPSKN
jgi:hypothetical protein